MKLIEGMKRLKVIEKRMMHNSERINQYAAQVSTERPIFGTDTNQRLEIASLIQANKDLAQEYLDLKKQVDLTNIQAQVQIGKESFAISDLLQIQRNVAKLMRGTYNALNDKLAEHRLTSIRLQSTDKAPKVERFYEENMKYDGLQYWQGLEDEIEIRLEVINATTELVEV